MEIKKLQPLLDKLNPLTEILKQCWDAETSSEENWSADNPSFGQAEVTALIVQDYCGGEIVNAKIDVPEWGKTVSHYFNNFSNLEVGIDLAWNQFPEDTKVPEGMPHTGNGAFKTTRGYVLSFEKTVERYEKLKTRVKKMMHRHGTGTGC